MAAPRASQHAVGSPAYLADVEACVAALRAHFASPAAAASLSTDARAFLTDATLRRYATARNGDFADALRNLEQTVAWRVEHVPAALTCPACAADAHSHCFFPIGVEPSKRRVVVYACAAKALMNEKFVTVQHMVHTLEHAWRATDALQLHPQWVWFVDFAGFSLWNAMQGSTSNGALSAFGTHMPERLGAVVLVNPPGVFDILLAAVRPFVDARTMGKVHIVRGDERSISAALEAHGIAAGAPDGMASWLSECAAMPGRPGSVPSDDKLDKAVLRLIRLGGCAHGNTGGDAEPTAKQ